MSSHIEKLHSTCEFNYHVNVNFSHLESKARVECEKREFLKHVKSFRLKPTRFKESIIRYVQKVLNNCLNRFLYFLFRNHQTISRHIIICFMCDLRKFHCA